MFKINVNHAPWYYYIRGIDMIYSDITITRMLETTYTYAR